MKIKKESLNNTIDEISNNLGANSSKAKDFVNSLDDQDIKEIKKLIKIFNKPIWKVVFIMIIASDVISLFYNLGLIVGELLR